MASDNDRISVKARTIAIVGAGPSGAIAAKYLLAEHAFDKIVLFEQRSQPGGIWNYTANQTNENLFSIPQTNPHKGSQEPAWQPNHSDTNNTNAANKTPSFLSPMYANLETNIPRSLMRFQDLNWPPESQLFPTHKTVLQYITQYSAAIQPLVHYHTQVTRIEPSNTSPTGPWTLTTKNLLTSCTQTQKYDAVIVANGHFTVPYVPALPGIQAWNQHHPGRISHSKYFRRAEDYAAKKVLVVGNSASGADVSLQISRVCERPLLWSSRSENMFSATHGSATSAAALRRPVPRIERFVPETRGVVFADGRQEDGIDAVVFCTGYFYSLPFLRDVAPPLVTTGERVNHTYKHVFYAPRPSLSFLALNQKVIPFPLAEAQAAVLARVYSGRLTLPSLDEMEAWETEVERESGAGREFHVLTFPKDGMYINKMSAWAFSAEKKDGLDQEGDGKRPPVWSEWEFWCRERFPKIRQAFGELGEKRCEIRDVEELGFDFEAFRRGREIQDRQKEVEGEEKNKVKDDKDI
ncbi:FAD/NAD(P)-binding domain-containing protein [Decorospora gaudefroyi]|uniref:FAD/NAD(P)-binding domain-containing protein n=1 Tax=Decorospora gaudefroyi TaxID=184978 RepID=A0A6A5KL62_9PLEO|nr:FAD/NAD(P)-binding domain-containing protein [Decorospora gaudefroyi]